MRLKDWNCLGIVDCGAAMVVSQIPQELGRLNASLGVERFRLDQGSARNGEAGKEKVEAVEEERAQLTAKVEKAVTESDAATEAVEVAELVEEVEAVTESTAEPKVDSEKEEEAAGLKAYVKSEHWLCYYWD